ncbi:MAG: phenylalanine--tRNA ligase subunit beta [Pseudonocardiales bacterium]|nr:MAG: phenylalanine--tRNA ligase subunit beta [Pseudonocardiales bacterium]
MRVPLSWLSEYVDLPAGTTAREVATALTRAGLEVETVTDVGYDVSGVVVGDVVEVTDLDEFKKPIRDCRVVVATGQAPRGIVCGARNFAVGDRVAVALPGAALPGGFEIGARKTYGRISDGMICSARELGVGDDHRGILVLPAGSPVGADVADLLHLRDSVIDIAVTPDRGYCLSVRGIAREAATAFRVGFRDPASVPPLVEPAQPEAQPAAIDDPAGADRIVLRAMSGVDPTRPTPPEMQRRLFLAGMRPISLPVDVTNYVMHELGQPLHAFDRRRLTGTVVVRRARPGERLLTLDHVERTVHPEDLLIADDSGPLSLAGTMGGLSSEVDDSTTGLVIEAVHFTAAAIARMSRRHALASEASQRFERGVDPELPPAASARAVRLLTELGGGTYTGSAEVDLPRARPEIALPAGLSGRIAGVAYDAETVVRRLTDVGCSVGGADPLTVTPPTWRPDLVDPYDLVEEVVRLEGYDRLPSVLPLTPAARGLTEDQRRRRAVSRALAATGYVEVLNHPFQSAEVLDALGVPVADDRRRLARLANPLSDQAPYLRTSLLPPLLQALRRNLSRGATDVALYEIGLVFLDRPGAPAAPRPSVEHPPSREELASLDAALPEQPLHVAAVLTGSREAQGWWGDGRPASWADAVEAARTVALAAGGAALTVEPADVAPWHPGRCAALSVDGRLIGHAGELHPRVTAALDLPPRTAAVELDLSALFAAQPGLVAAPQVSGFPPATQDVALVVDDDVPAAAVEDALREGAGDLLEAVRLFDVFAGEQIGRGRRSLAYALRFRAPDRTLTVQEATAARDAAVAEAARRTGAVLRS